MTCISKPNKSHLLADNPLTLAIMTCFQGKLIPLWLELPVDFVNSVLLSKPIANEINVSVVPPDFDFRIEHHWDEIRAGIRPPITVSEYIEDFPTDALPSFVDSEHLLDILAVQECCFMIWVLVLEFDVVIVESSFANNISVSWITN